MSFQAPFKLGRPRNELLFNNGSVDELASTFSYRYGPEKRRLMNIKGKRFQRVFRRLQKDYRFSLDFIDEVLVEKILSLEHIVDEGLSFVWSNGQKLISERYETDGLTRFTLDENSPTLLGRAYKLAGGADLDIINFDGVHTDYKPNGDQVSTNFFSSYDATNRIVTLSPSPGPVGTEVFVNWNYKGALVFMDPITPRHSQSSGVDAGEPLYDSLLIRLTGV